MAKYSGKIEKLYMDTSLTDTAAYKLVAEQTTCTLTLTRGEIDVTSKDNDDWGDFLAGRKSAELSFDFFKDYGVSSPKIGVDEIYAAWDAGAKKKFKLTSNMTGNKEFLFKGIVLECSQDLADNAGAKVSVKIRITENLTYQAVPSS